MNPGDPGTYIGRDGNWYDPSGNNLGPSGQAAVPTQAKTGAPYGASAVDRTVPAGPSGSTAPAAPAAPNIGAGALAPYGAAPPAFPTEPAYVPGTFTAPTIAEALNDPGYQFRTQQGEDALQRWAAAKGTLNDSGTAKALIDYGQNAAEQGYGNVYARDFGTWNANQQAQANAYGVNRQTQYIDPWTAAYNTWKQQGDFYLNNQGTVANASLGFGSLVNAA